MIRARRACLSVPATARTLAKGPGFAVDEVILDLEDSVPRELKAEARAALAEALSAQRWAGRTVSARINGVSTEWCADDVAVMVETGGARLDTVIVPKVESAADLAQVERMLGAAERAAGLADRVGIEALIETPAGLVEAARIAAGSARLEALIVGPADLAASLGLPDLEPEAAERRWGYARWTVLVAARAADIQAIDGPWLRFDDPAALRLSATRARELGFDGKWAIHPSQVAELEQVFSPAPAELEQARAILAALDHSKERGAIALGGEMIDEASRVRAEGLLARARAAGVEPPSA